MAPLTQRTLEELLDEAVRAGKCPPYIPAFNGNAGQSGLSALGIDDVAGKRVLDVGCNIGLRCFQAVEAGASRVVGVDVNPVRIAQARSLAERLGFPVEFRCLDAGRDAMPGQFDLVLCCGVLEHSRDPAALVNRLADAASEMVVLETEAIEGPHASQYLGGLKVRWWQRRALRKLPIVLVGRNGPNPLRPEAKFYFARPALQRLFLFHQPHFGDVQVVDSPFPGRCAVSARRRRIGHLVVIAGASCAGKTTFLNHVHSDAVQKLLASVGLGDLTAWRVASESDFYRLPAAVDQLCLHYDMNEAVRYGMKDFACDEGLTLVRAAERVTFLTFWAEPHVLMRRKRRAAPLSSGGLPERLRRVADRLLRMRVSAAARRFERRILARMRWDLVYLSDPRELIGLYDEWFRFCESSSPIGPFIIDTTGSEYALLDVTEWAARRNELPSESSVIARAG